MKRSGAKQIGLEQLLEFISGPRREAAHLGVCAVCLGATMTGCMLAPTDGVQVSPSATTAPQQFGGVVPSAGAALTVNYYQTTSKHYLPIATATSDTTAEDVDGTNLFFWGANAVIPSDGWASGVTGHVARVETVLAAGGSVGDVLLESFPPNWSICQAQNPRPTNFFENCKSVHSPEAFVYTTDFPAHAVMQMLAIWIDINGVLTVTVRNGGRHGKLTELDCNDFSNNLAVAKPFTTGNLIKPADVANFTIDLTANVFDDVECGVAWTDENGAAATACSQQQGCDLRTTVLQQ
jgi:hypothetical protein